MDLPPMSDAALGRAFGTPPYRWLAHGVFDDDPPTHLDDGIVVALEKLALPRGRSRPAADHLRSHAEAGASSLGLRARNRVLRMVTNDPKTILPTHAALYRDGTPELTFTAYPSAQARMAGDVAMLGAPPSARDAVRAMTDRVGRDLKAALDSGDFTHLLVMAMGWSNDQRVSLARYRRITQEARNAAGNRPFRPFILGVTWPSAWGSDRGSLARRAGHIGSYFNKANDSDEAGLVVANILLNRVVPGANATARLPVIVIGHSMGARLLSRALFSRPLLRDPGPRADPDLMILLQPAFSTRRFLGGTGVEGAPYARGAWRGADAMPATRIVVTSSDKDRANPFAAWSRFLGSGRGIRLSRRHPGTFAVSKPTLASGAAADWALAAPRDRIALVDATFVTHHNDILDAELGTFVRRLIDPSG